MVSIFPYINLLSDSALCHSAAPVPLAADHFVILSPAGAGSILSVVAEDGSLALLDVSQPLAVRPNFKARQELLREVLSTHSPPATLTQATPGQLGDHTLPGAAAAGGVGSSGGVGAGAALAAAAAGGAGAAGAGAAGVPAAVLGGGKAGVGGDGVSVPVVLLGPGALGCSMLLKQPWVLLLRALLQVSMAERCTEADVLLSVLDGAPACIMECPSEDTMPRLTVCFRSTQSL